MQLSDKRVIEAIRDGGSVFEKTIAEFIQNHQGLLHRIRQKYQVDLKDAKDLYADAVSHLIWNVKTGSFKGQSKLSTYLFQIYTHKTVDHIRHISTNKNKAYIELSEDRLDASFSLDKRIESTLDVELLKQSLSAMGEPCKGVIMDWAYWGYSMKEIAVRNQLDNAEKAKRKKYNCLQKLRSLLPKSD
jgi:RNA polymerase sigma factor (sigma-70 family)